MTEVRMLRCYVHGSRDQWEGLCVDLDIAAQGNSPAEVMGRLGEAIQMYVEAALEEAPADAERLLNRRAPWHVRAQLALAAFWYDMFHGRPGRKEERYRSDFPAPRRV